MSKKEDKNIIKRIKAGEITAFAELIDLHKSMAFTLALNILKNREEAEELTQDAFLKAFKNIHEFRGESAFSSWLYRIVFNLAISKKRLQKNAFVDLDNKEVKYFEINNTVDSMNRLETNDRKRILKQAISTLNSEDANIVLLYYYKELSIEEIAKITSLTISNIKVKLFRSRQQLYSALSVQLKSELTNILH